MKIDRSELLQYYQDKLNCINSVRPIVVLLLLLYGRIVVVVVAVVVVRPNAEPPSPHNSPSPPARA